MQIHIFAGYIKHQKQIKQMSRKYTYEIKLEFDKYRSECALKEDIQSSYQNGYEDTFIFQKKALKIIANRCKKYINGTILLSDEDNAIYNQVVKGLLFYYGIAKDFPLIKKISIVRKKSNNKILIYSEDKNNFNQPISCSLSKKYIFNPEKLKVIFKSSDKGKAIRIALSYWLKAISYNSGTLKFDNLFRAFDRLYLFNENTTAESTARKNIENLIRSKASIFSNTDNIAENLKLNGIGNTEWHDIFKKYKINHTENIDIVINLSIKQSYKIRNKMFHAEMPHSEFKVKQTKENIEIDLLNEVLESLIFELIENHNILRNV